MYRLLRSRLNIKKISKSLTFIDREIKNNLFTIYYILLSHKKHIKFYITNEK